MPHHLKGRTSIQGSSLTRWFFVGPAMLVVICLLIYPLCTTVLYSFTDKTMIRADFNFTGFENYTRILTDPDFWSSFANSLVWTIFGVLGQLVIGFTGALCLNRIKSPVMRNVFRITAIIPWAFPSIATAMVWKWLLNGIYGFVPVSLWNLGLTEGLVQFFSTPELVMPTLIFINIWFGYQDCRRTPGRHEDRLDIQQLRPDLHDHRWWTCRCELDDADLHLRYRVDRKDGWTCLYGIRPPAPLPRHTLCALLPCHHTLGKGG